MLTNISVVISKEWRREGMLKDMQSGQEILTFCFVGSALVESKPGGGGGYLLSWSIQGCAVSRVYFLCQNSRARYQFEEKF